MTVSPQWPQDGNRQPKTDANGVESGDSFRSPALPPTLFKLRNLNPASKQTQDLGNPPEDSRQLPPSPPVLETPASFPAQMTVETAISMLTTNAQLSNRVAAREESAAVVPESVGFVRSAGLEAEAEAEAEATPSAFAAEFRKTSVPQPPQAAAPEFPQAAAPQPPQAAAPEFPQAAAPQPPQAVAPEFPQAAEGEAKATVGSRRPSTSERASDSADQPAGRSWMEQIGSHGVVVVLLLIVVTAALATGRNSGSHESDSSIAASEELSNFNDGTKLDLPLPKHRSDESAGFASTEGVDPRTQEQGSQEHDATRSSLNPDASAARMLATAGDQSNAKNPSADQPLPSSAGAFQSSATNWKADQAEGDRIASNRFSNGSTKVDAFPASSRFPTERSESTLPTLEDLADDATSSGQQNVLQPSAPTRHLSKTPTGINDWLQYLPAYESAPVAGSEIPSTSK